MIRTPALLAATAAAAALAACDGGTDPNMPPSVTIEEPDDGAVFTDGEMVTFRGSATDPEEGALSGSSLQWRSDEDGVLGTGREVTSTLSLGTHEVVLRATDSDGESGADTVEVTVEPAAAFTCPGGGGRAVSLAVGERLFLRSPSDFCLDFAPEGSDEAYLVGVQSTTETASSLTPVRMRADAESSGDAGDVPPAAARSPEPDARGSDPRALLSERALRRRSHRSAEARIRAWEREHFGGADFEEARRVRAEPDADGLVETFAIPADLEDGDVFEVRVPDLVDGEENLCEDFVTIDAEVELIGERSVWLVDRDNPPNGLTTSDLQELSDRFDETIFDVNSAWFGAPTDIDDNGRIAILLTKEVNRSENLLGFAFSGDLLPRSRCRQSNEGEIYYGRAPDPNGTFGDPYTVQDAKEDAPFLIAHEFTHIIQFGRRIEGGATSFPAVWMAEGQATLAEEVNGYAFTGLGPRQNHGFEIAFNEDQRFDIDWFSNAFVDMALYFGFRQGGKIEEAPHECTWLTLPSDDDDPNEGPCIGNRQVYGVPWSLLRWISDHLGPGFAGGERAIQRALVDNDATGFENVEQVLGVEMEDLLAEWAPMLYVDDRVAGLEPRLTFPSWDLFEIFEENLVEAAQLQPMEEDFDDFTLEFEVRGGSSAYVRLEGTGRPTTTVAVSDLTGSELPGHMQVWVVRLR